MRSTGDENVSEANVIAVNCFDPFRLCWTCNLFLTTTRSLYGGLMRSTGNENASEPNVTAGNCFDLFRFET